jgi:mannose-6-phosphate isomerase-like protein (cupin superfamily)
MPAALGRGLESLDRADYRSEIVHPQWQGGKRPRREQAVFRIFHLDRCPASPMESGRGEQIKLINPSLGTEKVDVHLNRLKPGGPRGKRHHHSNADNVYIVKRGQGTLTVEDQSYVIRENDVVYIPAGMTHSLSNLGSEVFEIFEIYAPSGRQMDFVLDE